MFKDALDQLVMFSFQLLNWVFDHMGASEKKKNLQSLLSAGKVKVSYLPYDWSINSTDWTKPHSHAHDHSITDSLWALCFYWTHAAETSDSEQNCTLKWQLCIKIPLPCSFTSQRAMCYCSWIFLTKFCTYNFPNCIAAFCTDYYAVTCFIYSPTRMYF